MTRLGRWLSPGVRFEGGAAAWFCARCGYECRGGEAVRCSECGAEIDPSTGRGLRRSAPGALAQALMRAPALPMLACGLMAAAALAWGRSVPGGYFLWQMVAAAALVLLTGLSLLRMLAAGFVSNRHGRLGDCARQRGWWAVPAACIAATAVALSPLPLYGGFRMRRGAGTPGDAQRPPLRGGGTRAGRPMGARGLSGVQRSVTPHDALPPPA
ncbi:MAG: hypothetical protein ACKOFI_12625, partial [Phycisphaerales bacterium]